MTTKIDMHLSVRSIDLDFKSGTFKLSGMMSLEWKDPRLAHKLLSNQFTYLILLYLYVKICLGPL